MTLQIIGAGLAGLLAANMLRHRQPIIQESQPELPNNHSAVLRFRTSAIGDALNIPFKKVTMIKTHVPGPNLVHDALSYSYKNTGKFRSDRSITAGMVTAERFIAPSDLIARMAVQCRIIYNKPFLGARVNKGEWAPIISTIPMPVLMKLLDYPLCNSIVFSSTPGVNITAKIINCDAYVSLLVPDQHYGFSRISITGNEMILECPNVSGIVDAWAIAQEAMRFLGVHALEPESLRTHQARYAKINPIDDDARKDFIYWATDTHGIFSLGRFATWRPGLLLDDLVQDIRLIDKWLDKKDRYAIARAR